MDVIPKEEKQLFDSDETKVFIHGLKYDVDEASKQACFYIEDIEETCETVAVKNKKFLWQSQKWIITIYDETRLPANKHRTTYKRTISRRIKLENEVQNFEVTEMVSFNVNNDYDVTAHLREYIWTPAGVNKEESYIMVTYIYDDNKTESEPENMRKVSTSYGANTTHEDFEQSYENEDGFDDCFENPPAGGLARLTYLSEKLMRIEHTNTEDDRESMEIYEIDPLNIKLSCDPTSMWVSPYEGKYGLSTSHFQLSERFGSSYGSQILKVTTRGGYLSDFSMSFSEATRVKRFHKGWGMKTTEYDDLPNDVVVIDKVDMKKNQIKERSDSTSDDEGFEDIGFECSLSNGKPSSSYVSGMSPTNQKEKINPDTLPFTHISFETPELKVPVLTSNAQQNITHKTPSNAVEFKENITKKSLFSTPKTIVDSPDIDNVDDIDGDSDLIMLKTTLEKDFSNEDRKTEFAVIEDVKQKSNSRNIQRIHITDKKDHREMLTVNIEPVNFSTPQEKVRKNVVHQDDKECINEDEIISSSRSDMNIDVASKLDEQLHNKSEPLPKELAEFQMFNCNGITLRNVITDKQFVDSGECLCKPEIYSKPDSDNNDSDNATSLPLITIQPLCLNPITATITPPVIRTDNLNPNLSPVCNTIEEEDVKEVFTNDVFQGKDEEDLFIDNVNDHDGTDDIDRDDVSLFKIFCDDNDGIEIKNTKVDFVDIEDAKQKPIILINQRFPITDKKDHRELLTVNIEPVNFSTPQEEVHKNFVNQDDKECIDEDEIISSCKSDMDIDVASKLDEQFRNESEPLPKELAEFQMFNCNGITPRNVITDKQFVDSEECLCKPEKYSKSDSDNNDSDNATSLPLITIQPVFVNPISTTMKTDENCTDNINSKIGCHIIEEEGIEEVFTNVVCQSIDIEDLFIDTTEENVDNTDLDLIDCTEIMNNKEDVSNLEINNLNDLDSTEVVSKAEVETGEGNVSIVEELQSLIMDPNPNLTRNVSLEEEKIYEKYERPVKQIEPESNYPGIRPVMMVPISRSYDDEEKVSIDIRTREEKDIIDEDSCHEMILQDKNAITDNNDSLGSLTVLTNVTEIGTPEKLLNSSIKEDMVSKDRIEMNAGFKNDCMNILSILDSSSDLQEYEFKGSPKNATETTENASDERRSVTIKSIIVNTENKTHVPISNEKKFPVNENVPEFHSQISDIPVFAADGEDEEINTSREVINTTTTEIKTKKKSLKSRAKKIFKKINKTSKSEEQDSKQIENIEIKKGTKFDEMIHKGNKLRQRLSFKKSRSDDVQEELTEKSPIKGPKRFIFGKKRKNKPLDGITMSVSERVTLLRQRSEGNLLDDNIDEDAKLRSFSYFKRSRSVDSILDYEDEADRDRDRRERRRRLAGYSYVTKINPPKDVIKGREYTIEACEKETEKELNFVRRERAKSLNSKSMENNLDLVEHHEENVGHLTIPSLFQTSPKIVPLKSSPSVGRVTIPKAFSIEDLSGVNDGKLKRRITKEMLF